jgi:hypothetical protein
MPIIYIFSLLYPDTPAHAAAGVTMLDDGFYFDCFENQNLNTCPDNEAGVDPGLDPVNNFMNVSTITLPCLTVLS